MNKYLLKLAERYPDHYENIPQVKKMGNDIKQYKARIEGLRKARRLLKDNPAFAPSTKRRHAKAN